MEFRVLGPVAFRGAGAWTSVPRRQERALLAVLLLEAGRPVGTDRIAALLWPGGEPDGARATIRAYVSRLRQALRDTGPEDSPTIVQRDGAYVLNLDPRRVDAHRFLALLRGAGELSDPGQRAARLREALALWSGPALADVGPDSVRERLAAPLEQDRHRAVRLRIDADLEAGRHEELIGELTGLVAGAPLDEHLVAGLMTALHRAGRRNDSLDAYQALRRRMADELGLDPGSRVRELHASILRDETGPAPAVAPRFLPRPIADFTGREDIGAEVLRRVTLPGPQAPPVYAFDGMPGVGKSTLAVQLAHRLAAHYPDGQLAVDLRAHAGSPPLDPATALALLLGQLGVDPVPEDLDGLILAWRAHTADRRVLVLLDDAAGSAQVQPLLPTGAGCLTFVTSRRRLAGLDGVTCVPLAPLSPESAVELLGRIVGERSALAPDETAAVARHCGFLPLAVRLAAARLVNRPGWTMADLVDRIGSASAALRETAVEGRTVAAAFELSYQQLGPESQRMFRLVALLPAVDFDAYAAAALAGGALAHTQDLLDDLVDNHLLEEPKAGRYRAHDLLREYARRILTERDETAVVPLVRYYLHAAAARSWQIEQRPFDYRLDEPDFALPPLGDEAAATAWFETERGNLVGAVALAERHGLDAYAWKLARSLWRFLMSRRHTAGMIDVMTRAVGCADRLGDDRAAAITHNYLAAALYCRAEWPRALETLEIAMRRAETTGDPGLTAMVSANMVGVLQPMGRFAEALDHARRGVRFAEATGNRQQLSVAHNRVASALHWSGRYREAIAAARLAIEVLGDDEPGFTMADALSSMGRAWTGLGDLDRAERCLTEAQRLAEGPRRSLIAEELLSRMAVLRRLQGDLDEAIRLHREMLTPSGRALLAEDECLGRNEYGTTLRVAGDAEGAREQHTRALALADRLGYPAQQAHAHDGLGDLLGDLLAAADPEAAAGHWRQAYDLYRRLGVPEQHTVAAKLAGADPLGAEPLGAEPLGADLVGTEPLGAERPGTGPPPGPASRLQGANPSTWDARAGRQPDHDAGAALPPVLPSAHRP